MTNNLEHFGYKKIFQNQARNLLRNKKQVFIELVPNLQQHYLKDNKLHLLNENISLEDNLKYLIENYEYRHITYIDFEDLKGTIKPCGKYDLIASYYTNNKNYKQYHQEQKKLLKQKKESQQKIIQF